MRFSKIKKFAAAVLAVATVMTCGVVGAGAANVTVDEGTAVCADLYIPMNIHNIRKINAHLTDSSVPPTTVPSANNTTVTKVGDKMQITLELPNEVFVIEESNAEKIENGSYTAEGSNGGDAAIVGATWVDDSYRSGVKRASSLTIQFDSLDETYVFQGIEQYGNKHPYVVIAGGTGSHTYDMYFEVTQK